MTYVVGIFFLNCILYCSINHSVHIYGILFTNNIRKWPLIDRYIWSFIVHTYTKCIELKLVKLSNILPDVKSTFYENKPIRSTKKNTLKINISVHNNSNTFTYIILRRHNKTIVFQVYFKCSKTVLKTVLWQNTSFIQ